MIEARIPILVWSGGMDEWPLESKDESAGAHDPDRKRSAPRGVERNDGVHVA